MRDQLELMLLGSPQARRNGQPVTGFRSSKAQALLYYLAVTGRAHTRATLAGLFWGDQPEAAARASLSKCLSNLRDLVGDALLIERQTVAFKRDHPYQLDTERFMDAVGHPPTAGTVHSLQSALALYHGDFLEGFYVRDAPDFEQWVLVQRAHYRETVVNGLHALANFCEQQGDLLQAITHTRHLVGLEPWREEAHRQLMSRLARSGQRAAALAQFEICRRVLDEELAVEPDAETMALLEAIRAGEFDKMTRGQDDKMRIDHPATLSPLHPIMNTLPIPPTPLIGRERELAELGGMISNPACRLITIAGPGGMGKTRLALAVAHQQSDTLGKHVVFVPLAALSDATLLPQTLLAALNQPAQSHQDTSTQLIDYLRRRKLLLVLDNYDQLLPNVELLSQLLLHTPGLQLLVTSRERLALQAEQLFVVIGLPYPQTYTQKGLGEFAAIQLFLQRARQIHLHFSPDESEMAAIATICRHCEGMPLALELAAGGLGVQSCLAIANALATGQALMISRLRDRPSRHASIRNVFEQSWQLLTLHEQQVFCRLAIFRGGWQIEAAQSVANASPELLTILLDKSLLRQMGQGRLDIHPLLRQFGEQKLAEAGNDAEAHHRHLDYFQSLAKKMEPQIIGAPQEEILAAFAVEHDNFRAALIWGFSLATPSRPVIIAVVWLAARLGRFWFLGKHGQEGRGWLAQALNLFEAHAKIWHANDLVWARDEIELYAKLLYRTGMLQTDSSRSQALLAQSLHHYRSLQDLRAISRCLQELGLALSEQGKSQQAMESVTESLTFARRINDPWCLARSLVGLASLQVEGNKHLIATALLQESLQLFRQQRDGRGVISCLVLLAQCHLAFTEYAQASACLAEVLQIDRAINPGSKGGPWMHRTLGLVQQMQGNYEDAADSYRRSLQLRQDQQQVAGIAWAIEGLVEVAAATGQPGRAARLAGAADTLRHQANSAMAADDRPRYEQALHTVCTLLGEAQFQSIWADGAEQSIEQAVAYALADPTFE